MEAQSGSLGAVGVLQSGIACVVDLDCVAFELTLNVTNLKGDCLDEFDLTP